MRVSALAGQDRFQEPKRGDVCQGSRLRHYSITQHPEHDAPAVGNWCWLLLLVLGCVVRHGVACASGVKWRRAAKGVQLVLMPLVGLDVATRPSRRPGRLQNSMNDDSSV
jgi:hypothetical protein